MVVFALLYLIFVISFGVHLGQWDGETPGRCYIAHHPYVDRIYLGLTCLYPSMALFLALSLAISRCKVDPAWGKRRSALVDALIGFCTFYTGNIDFYLYRK